MTIQTDFTSHHIEGYARAAMERGWNGSFSCPLITEIEPNFWQGGCRNGVLLSGGFDRVLSLYQWEKFKLEPQTERVEVEMYDSGNIPDPDQLNELADMINEWRDEGLKVLVHCQAGLNRSGLLAGLSLVKRGMKPQDAIDLMRSKRSPMVLCNEAFESWLLYQGDDGD